MRWSSTHHFILMFCRKVAIFLSWTRNRGHHLLLYEKAFRAEHMPQHVPVRGMAKLNGCLLVLHCYASPYSRPAEAPRQVWILCSQQAHEPPRDARRLYDASDPEMMNITACGGWTPGLDSRLDSLCEASTGSECTFRIPFGSATWKLFEPENLPTWT